MKGIVGVVASAAALLAGCYGSTSVGDDGDHAGDVADGAPDTVEDRPDFAEARADADADEARGEAEEDTAEDEGDHVVSCSRTDDCSQGSRCIGGYCSVVLPTLGATGADMTCLRDNPPPVPGVGTIGITAYVEDFQDEYRVQGATIDFFFDDVVDGSPDATVGPTDSAGEVRVGGVPRDNLIAYRVRGGDLPDGRVKETIEYDIRTPTADGAALRLLSVSDMTYRLIPTILGITPDAGHGVVLGEFDDCAGNPVEGFVVRFLTETGEDCHVLHERECFARYFQDGYPSRIDNQPHSSADGLFAMVQVPPGTWTAQVLGRLTDDTATYPYDLLGEKRVAADADAIVIMRVEVLPE